jgi:hypothetical protein
MSRRLPLAASFLGFFGQWCAAHGALYLDQALEYNQTTDILSGTAVDSVHRAAQSFTSSLNGRLVFVEPLIDKGFQSGSSSGPLTLEIQTLDSMGFPSGNILGSATIPMDDIPANTASPRFDLTASNILVSPGLALAIVLSSPSSAPYTFHQVVKFSVDAFDGYPGGQALVDLPVWHPLNETPGGYGDLGFRTYVDTAVPEPSTVCFGVGCVFAMFKRRRPRLAALRQSEEYSVLCGTRSEPARHRPHQFPLFERAIESNPDRQDFGNVPLFGANLLQRGIGVQRNAKSSEAVRGGQVALILGIERHETQKAAFIASRAS